MVTAACALTCLIVDVGDRRFDGVALAVDLVGDVGRHVEGQLALGIGLAVALR